MGWAVGLQWFGWALLVGALVWALVRTLRRPAERVVNPGVQTLIACLFAFGFSLSFVGALLDANWWAMARQSVALAVLAALVFVTRRGHQRAGTARAASTPPEG